MLDLCTAETLFTNILAVFARTGVLPYSDREILKRCSEAFREGYLGLQARGSNSEYLHRLASALFVTEDGTLDWKLECLPVSVMAEIVHPCGHLVEESTDG